MTLTDDVFRDRLVVIAGKCSQALVLQIRGHGARDLLHIGHRNPVLPDCHFAVWEGSSRVGANNCTTAILFGRAALALRSRRFFQSFAYICLPFGWGWVMGLLGLIRYGYRRRLALAGWTRLAGSHFAVPVFSNANYAGRRRTRIYGPDRRTPKEVLQSIADLDCILLRWINKVEDGSHRGDLDILASSGAAEIIEARLAEEAGTAPIDLYSEDGSGGRTFKSVTYFPPSMARKMISTAVVRPSGLRVASVEWQFVSFCFHLLFHKSAQLEPGTEALSTGTFSKTDYMLELNRLAREAGLPAPRSVSEIEAILRDRDVFPEIDTIGFLSEGNGFLRHRYRDSESRVTPGLAVFVVRDFNLGPDLVSLVRDEIKSSGFRILDEFSVGSCRGAAIAERIRGGNWQDGAATGGTALPIYAFICHDPNPLPPSTSVRRRYPRLDNERMLLKERIRTSVAEGIGARKLNVVHASDNSAEAEAYIRALGARVPAGFNLSMT